MVLLSLIWVLNSSDSCTPTINPSLQRDTPNQEFGSILKCRNWPMLTALIHANYCLLSLFITWRMRLFKRSSKSSDNSCFQLWIIFCSFSLFHKGSHWISFHFFFLCLTWQLLAFLALSEKKKNPSEMFISWGKSLGNSMFITSRVCNPKAAPGPPVL